MPVLSYEQVYALARWAGCTEAQAIIATAITEPESGRDTHCVGDSRLAKYGSRGLWQLFTGAHPPAELDVGTGPWTGALAEKLFDPFANASAMWIVSSQGRNWRPWSAYVHLAHVPFLAPARAAAAAVEKTWGAHLPAADPGGTPVSVIWRGHKFDKRTAAMLAEVAKLTRATITPTQGSYSTGVGASAGTHAGGGAVDLHAAGLPKADIEQIIKVMRQVGFAAWHRMPADGPWPEHIHGVAVGCSDLAPAAARQVTALRHGLNGLANGHHDPSAALGLPVVTWEHYLAHRDAPAAPAPKPASKPAAKPRAKVVKLANVIAAAKADPHAKTGAKGKFPADVKPVEAALVAEGLLDAKYADGSFGTRTVEAYRAWQKKLGYHGADLDLPGTASLHALGRKHGFTVK